MQVQLVEDDKNPHKKAEHSNTMRTRCVGFQSIYGIYLDEEQKKCLQMRFGFGAEIDYIDIELGTPSSSRQFSE